MVKNEMLMRGMIAAQIIYFVDLLKKNFEAAVKRCSLK